MFILASPQFKISFQVFAIARPRGALLRLYEGAVVVVTNAVLAHHLFASRAFL